MRPARAVLAVALSLSVIVVGGPTAQAAPVDAAAAATATTVLDPPEPAVAARGAAGQQAGRTPKAGAVTARRVAELTAQRSATVKRYRMSDGTVEAELFPGPVHYRDRSGAWRDVDTRIGESGKPGYAFGNTATGFDSHFGRSSERLVSFEADGRSIQLGTPGGGRAATPVVSGDTITYQDLFGAADVRYRVGPRSLKEEIILDAKPHASSYTFSMRLAGLRTQAQSDGSVHFYRDDDRNARPVFVMPKPFMTDSAPDPSSPYRLRWSDKVTQTVTQRGDEFEITVTADPAWLAAADRVYPS